MIYNYLKTIGDYPLLSWDEEIDLAKKIAAGDTQAKEKLITYNLRLVIPVAQHYNGATELSFEDLIQEGNLGLIKAAEDFDYKLGNRFSTFATWWIRQSISRALANKSKTIRIPAHLTEKINKLNQIQKDLTQKLQREVGLKDLIENTNFTEEQILQLLKLNNKTVSLDRPIDEEDETSFGDLLAAGSIGDPQKELAKEEKAFAIKEVLSTLPERESFIIIHRFGLDDDKPKTLEEIGEQLGLTRERVRQLEEKALSYLPKDLQGLCHAFSMIKKKKVVKNIPDA